ncbi:hypothetical protein C6496_13885 [Candidatus Poribacteria bacterium]|nr:MAG: hypothetical protein C6496_13885 [Candidatus Poribacteria bacterium]
MAFSSRLSVVSLIVGALWKRAFFSESRIIADLSDDADYVFGMSKSYFTVLRIKAYFLAVCICVG